MKNIIILISFLFLFSVIFTSSAFAKAAQIGQSSQTDQNIKALLSVSPAIIDTTIKKGQANIYQIKVKNLLNEPLGIRTSIESFSARDEKSVNPTNNHSPMMDFSTLSQESFIIEPGQTKEFNLKINPPKTLLDGGYYEAIFLTPFYVKTNAPNSPTVLTKIGILVFANAGDINYKKLTSKVSVTDLKIEKDKPFLTTTFSVKNLYFNHFSAKPFLTLTPLLGKPQRYELTEKKILPGKIRSWEEIIKPQKSLIYKAELAVSVGQGNYVYKSVWFTLIPFKTVTLVIILILFVSFILLRITQIKKAIQIVLKGK